ncbi:MAG: hypothetical protein ACK41C_10415 [Phenylobacterium sp.]|uniref:hypothetical protein n=1 Tax=Phenylobacterium sp. TaxID=1871053 RepID=UPI003919F405
MAKFVRFEGLQGEPLMVNMDQVLFIENNERDYSQLVFALDQDGRRRLIVVKGAPEEIYARVA